VASSQSSTHTVASSFFLPVFEIKIIFSYDFKKIDLK
jgi:hypothetical protein